MKNNRIPLLPGVCYHIFNHANGFENLFRNKGNYDFFLKKYIKYIPAIADTYVYCLMPNHIHLVVRIKSEEDLPAYCKVDGKANSNKICQQFGNVFSAYAQAFNKQQSRMGGLFIPNFKRKPVENAAYFRSLIPYVHLNAVVAKFVSHPADWPHSSFATYLSDCPSRLDRERVFNFFGGREGFLQAHKLPVEDWFLKFMEDW